MSGRIISWSHDAGRLYLLYVAAGAAAIPAGVAYSLIVLAGWEKWWTVVLLLAAGVLMARTVWRSLENRLYQFKVGPPRSIHFALNGLEPQTASSAVVACALLTITVASTGYAVAIQPGRSADVVPGVEIHRYISPE